MARPTKKGLDYFPHDTDAVNDEKIEALRSLHGNDGYAFYFILLERIYRSHNQEISVSEAETIQILARKVSVSEEKFTEILQTALRWGCFDKKRYEEDGVLTSNGIKQRARPVLAKRATMKERYQDTKEEIVSEAETRSKEKESKGKESKGKESKGNNKFTPPTIPEIRDYCKERNNNIDPEHFHAWYSAKGWMLGKNKMKDWKQAVITWEKRDNDSGKSPQRKEPDYT